MDGMAAAEVAEVFQSSVVEAVVLATSLVREILRLQL